MNRSIASAILAIAVLAACSKPAPTPPAGEAAAPAAVAEPKPAKPSMGPADYPAKLLLSIDTAPQCQPFRAQIEEAARSQSGESMPVDMNQLNAIAAKAYQAGCYRRP